MCLSPIQFDLNTAIAKQCKMPVSSRLNYLFSWNRNLHVEYSFQHHTLVIPWWWWEVVDLWCLLKGSPPSSQGTLAAGRLSSLCAVMLPVRRIPSLFAGLMHVWRIPSLGTGILAAGRILSLWPRTMPVGRIPSLTGTMHSDACCLSPSVEWCCQLGWSPPSVQWQRWLLEGSLPSEQGQWLLVGSQTSA